MCELDILCIVCLGLVLQVKKKEEELSNLSVMMTHVSISFNLIIIFTLLIMQNFFFCNEIYCSVMIVMR